MAQTRKTIPVNITIRCVGATDAALKFDDGRRTFWLPKSQITYADGVLTLPQWLAENNRLI